VLAAVALAVPVAPAGAHTLPLGDACLQPLTAPPGMTSISPNVEHLGTMMGEAGALDAGGRLVGHYFYVTGSTHFSIYDVADPVQPKLMSRVDFPCRFENEDVTGNADLLIYSDFATSGDLYVYDVRDKRHPKLVSDTPGLGTHTMECVEDCRYLYGSYFRSGPKGPLSGGEVVDLADPAHPKVLGDWTANDVLPSQKVHDVTEVSPGRVITASAPIEYLDTSSDRARPKLLARSDTPADKRFHTTIWPRGGTDRFMLAMFETNATPNCAAGSGEFTVFDATQWQTTGKFKPLQSFFLSSGDFADGNPPANGLGCSPHWFNVRPSWQDGGVVAMGAYDHGTKFLRVDDAGKITEVGHFLPPGTNASAAYWITCDVVYVVDYTRGIDILRFKDQATACQGPSSEQPSSNEPVSTPSADAPTCVRRRDFRISLPPGARSARVVVDGRRVEVARRGRRLTAPIDMRGRPGGVVTVRMRMTLRSGQTVTRVRRYRTCVPSGAGQPQTVP
jgi:hypothetical protein